jgi:HAD superfamily hydrolase (TIGR01509 family)
MQQTDEAQIEGGTDQVAPAPAHVPEEAPDEVAPSALRDAAAELDESPAPVSVPDPGGLLFDLDGTLVDTVNIRIEAWLRTFAEIGFPAERSHVAGLIGADGKRLAMEVAAIGGRRLSEDRAQAVDRRAGEIFSELNRDPRPLPGVVELLRALDAAGVPWAIATSSRREQVATSVEALSLPRPPTIVDGSHVAQAKPAPDLLLYAADQLDLPTHRCWYAGDATWDMRAARAASMVGVGVATGAVTMEALRAAGARLAFPTMHELHLELTGRDVVPPPA